MALRGTEGEGHFNQGSKHGPIPKNAQILIVVACFQSSTRKTTFQGIELSDIDMLSKTRYVSGEGRGGL